MGRSDIATLLRKAASAMPAVTRSRFVGFLAEQAGGKRVKHRRVHSWHRKVALRASKHSPRGADPRQGRLL
jgi:hypothetical protein